MLGELIVQMLFEVLFEAILKPIVYVLKLLFKGLYRLVRLPYDLLAAVLLADGGPAEGDGNDQVTRSTGDGPD